jgi:hypothetical protein
MELNSRRNKCSRRKGQGKIIDGGKERQEREFLVYISKFSVHKLEFSWPLYCLYDFLL